MRQQPITLSRKDAARLRELLAGRVRAGRDQAHLQELTAELERARIIENHEVPSDLITIGASLHIFDLMTGERRDITLVLPRESDPGFGRISVLAPLGTALLGFRAGDRVEWQMPGGMRRLRVDRVEPAVELHASPAATLRANAGGKHADPVRH